MYELEINMHRYQINIASGKSAVRPNVRGRARVWKATICKPCEEFAAALWVIDGLNSVVRALELDAQHHWGENDWTIVTLCFGCLFVFV